MNVVTHIEGELHQTANVTGVDHGWLAFDRTTKFGLHQRVDSGKSVGLRWVRTASDGMCNMWVFTRNLHGEWRDDGVFNHQGHSNRPQVSLFTKTGNTTFIRTLMMSESIATTIKRATKKYCTYVVSISWASSSRVYRSIPDVSNLSLSETWSWHFFF